MTTLPSLAGAREGPGEPSGSGVGVSRPRALARRVRQRGEETLRTLLCAIENARLRARRGVKGDAPIRLLCLVDLVQDLDVILPIALAARHDGRYAVSICMTTWLEDVAPWVPTRLARYGFEPLLATRKQLQTGQAPDIAPFDVLLTACESTAAAHRFAHALVRRANQAGLHTFTVQHGLENLGLTSRAGGDFEFASQSIFVWRAPQNLPPWVPATRRRRCIGVGRAQLNEETKDGDWPSELAGVPLVAVFENLHWDRYPPGYSGRFLGDLATTARENPHFHFLIKPHPAGLWLVKNPDAMGQRPSNLTIASPTTSQWSHVTAGAIIRRAAAVVTTPSTISLDAATQGKPVAVVGYGLNLDFYTPLSRIAQSSDWSAFLQEVQHEPQGFSGRLQAFSRRHLIDGDARDRILHGIVERVASPHSTTP